MSEEEDFISALRPPCHVEQETVRFILDCVKDFETDGLGQDYLWSLLFQFLNLSSDKVKQAAVDAQWEWAK